LKEILLGLLRRNLLKKVMNKKINYNGVDYLPLELALLKGENKALKQLLLFGGNYVDFHANSDQRKSSQEECSSRHCSVSGNILHTAVLSDQISLLSYLLKWLFNHDDRIDKNNKKKEMEKQNKGLNNNENKDENSEINNTSNSFGGDGRPVRLGMSVINDSSTDTRTYSLLFDLLYGTDKSVRTPLMMAQDMKKV
jgi:hypothetical protein